jgi:hypothetical protein
MFVFIYIVLLLEDVPLEIGMDTYIVNILRLAAVLLVDLICFPGLLSFQMSVLGMACVNLSCLTVVLLFPTLRKLKDRCLAYGVCRAVGDQVTTFIQEDISIIHTRST